MDRTLISILLLIGCSDVNAAPRELFCGWFHKKDIVMAADSPCYRIVPPRGMAITPPGADACDVDAWQQPSVWRSGDTVELWTRSSTSGKLTTPADPVECPKETP